MKHIAIIGGTGAAGKEVVRLALAANYNVTLVARNPHLIQPENNLSVVKGDVTNLESLKQAFKNMDAVISCFGPANGRKAGNLMSVGTANIVQACAESGVTRFIFMSGILQTDGSELTFLNRLGIKFMRQFFKEVYKDKITAETAIQNSPLDWVIFRAVGLTHTQPTGQYKAGVNIQISPFTLLPYADCALCLVDAVHETKWSKQIINLGRK